MSKPRSTQDNNDMSNPDQETQAPKARSKRASSSTTSPASR
jgi:hypothetical protein